MHKYFETRIDVVDECWLWKLAKNTQGHGICTSMLVDGVKRTYTAHRLSYLLHSGEISNGLVVRHTCTNKSCCNPAHLILGTQSDNYYDIPEDLRKELHRKSAETTRNSGVLKGRNTKKSIPSKLSG